MAKKRTKFPKKFRQTLEKVAEKRDERKADEALSQNARRAVDTLIHEFLPSGSVHFMHTRLNDEATRMDTIYHLEPSYKHDYVQTTPPWPPIEKPVPE